MLYILNTLYIRSPEVIHSHKYSYLYTQWNKVEIQQGSLGEWLGPKETLDIRRKFLEEMT